MNDERKILINREQAVLESQGRAVRRIYRLFSAAIGYANNFDLKNEKTIGRMTYQTADFLTPLDKTIYRLMFSDNYNTDVFEEDINKALSLQIMLKGNTIIDTLSNIALPAILLVVPLVDQELVETEELIQRIKSTAVERSRQHVAQTAPLGSTRKRYSKFDREALAKSIDKLAKDEP